jgi:DNA-binding IclR family transcriptional regulator
MEKWRMIRNQVVAGMSSGDISQLVGIKRSTVHGILKSVSEKPTP